MTEWKWKYLRRTESNDERWCEGLREVTKINEVIQNLNETESEYFCYIIYDDLLLEWSKKFLFLFY